MSAEAQHQRPPLALIVSEQEWASRSLDSILAPQGYAILRAYSGKQALERAASTPPDVLFVDFLLPDFEGVGLCRELRQSGTVPATTPVFLLRSGLVGRQERIDAYQAGAWDLLSFPLDAQELVARLDCYLRAKRASDQAESEALVDQPTGAYSWQGIVRRAQEIGAAANRHRRAFACLVFSLDPVEPVSGPGPAPEAQLLLRSVADAIRSAIRTSDSLGRLGKGELVVLAPETGRDGAEVLARRINAALGSLDAGRRAGGNIRLHVGSYAVDDFHEAGIDPIEVLVRASTGSREGRSGAARGHSNGGGNGGTPVAPIA